MGDRIEISRTVASEEPRRKARKANRRRIKDK
jgi:hypothetical protein